MTSTGRQAEGGWGWVVVFGSHIIQAITGGGAACMGLFLLEWLEEFQTPVSTTSWIISIVPLLTGFLSPLSSVLSQRFGHRKVCCIGAVLASTGGVLSAFVTTLTQLYFTFSLLVGIGCGLIFAPSVVIVGIYFKERFALANALASSGINLGQIAFPPLFAYLISVYGWRGALIVIAAFNTNMFVASCLFRPIAFQMNPIKIDSANITKADADIIELNESDAEPAEDITNELNEADAEPAKDITNELNEADAEPAEDITNELNEADAEPAEDITNELNEADAEPAENITNELNEADSVPAEDITNELNEADAEPAEDITNELNEADAVPAEDITNELNEADAEPAEDITNELNEADAEPAEDITNATSSKVGSCCRTTSTATGIPELCYTPHFPIALVSAFTIGLNLYCTAVYIAPRAIDYGYSKTQGAILLSLFGVGNLLGRLFNGIIIDLKYASTQTGFTISLAAVSIEMLLTPLSSNFVMLMVFVITLGISLGINIGPLFVIAREVSPAHLLGPVIGFTVLMMTCGNGFGVFLGGWLSELAGNYEAPFYACGAVTSVTTVLFLPTHRWLRNKKQEEATQNP